MKSQFQNQIFLISLKKLQKIGEVIEQRLLRRFLYKLSKILRAKAVSGRLGVKPSPKLKKTESCFTAI